MLFCVQTVQILNFSIFFMYKQYRHYGVITILLNDKKKYIKTSVFLLVAKTEWKKILSIWGGSN